MFNIQVLAELGNTIAETGGNKAANLGRLLNAGVNVPHGYVILSHAFDDHCRRSGALNYLGKLRAMVSSQAQNAKDIAVCAEHIRKLIEDADISPSLVSHIEIFSQRMGSSPVAIRSSSLAEDMNDLSWAGQFDSFLNISEDRLVSYIKRCWASAFSDRAIAYGVYRGQPPGSNSMAVLVQQMIQSEVSGVSFSMHPVSGDKDKMLIEAGRGLGDTIVSGMKNVDRYVLQKDNGFLLERHIVANTEALVHDDSSLTDSFVVDNSALESPVLQDSQIEPVHSLTNLVHKLMGFPCEIEWAYSRNKLYLLQARPITQFIYQADAQKKSDCDHRALMVSHQSDLLTQDLVLTGVQRFCDFKRFGLSFSYPYIRYEHKTGDITYPANQVDEFGRINLPLSTLEELVIYLRQELQEYREYLNQFSVDVKETPKPGLVREYFERSLRSAGTIPYFICFDICVTKAMNEAGLAIADVAAAPPATAEADASLRDLRMRYCSEIEQSVAGQTSISSDLLNELETFCQTYGYLGLLYFKGTPWTVVDAYKMLASMHIDEPKAKIPRILDERIMAVASELLMLRTEKWEIMCLGASLFQEHVKKFYSRVVNYESLLELRIDQVCDLLDRKLNLRNITPVKGAFVLQINEDAVVLSDEIVGEPKVLETRKGKILKGVSANLGKATGIARVILSARESSDFQPGDILVTKMSTPDFLPLMRNATAFITEIGGVTSHAAILSRELGVPCVIAVRGVTSLLKSGDLVEVDATLGTIKVIQ